MIRSGVISSFSTPNDYYELCEINRTKIAIFLDPIIAEENFQIDLRDHIVVFLAPLESKKNIRICAISVVTINTLKAGGELEIIANEKYISLVKSVTNSGFKVIANNGAYNPQVEKEKSDKIARKFKKGITNQQALKIVQALIYIFMAVENPKEKENIRVDTFNFFKIRNR